MKKLAICIPTYNRDKLLDRLLKSIPKFNDIVVSICDDGSKDNTNQIIKNHQNRLSINYIYQQNRGRASALRKSILNVKAEFFMLVDSDDYFEKDGIETIYNFIKDNSSEGFFVFPTRIVKNSKSMAVSLSDIPKTSYITLRSDYKIKYDLQEVIHSKILLEVLYEDPIDIRRIPTSYLWFKASEKAKCIPVDCEPVKTKEYLDDGMTANLLPLKIRYPKYMVYKYKIALESKDYRSLSYRFKYKILFYRYCFHNRSIKLSNFGDFLFYFIGFIYGFFDLLRLVIFFKK
tara:strand:+ start:1001 stop:1867 length:867 start_codon:yes stop_codon:yes gene_type:complete